MNDFRPRASPAARTYAPALVLGLASLAAAPSLGADQTGARAALFPPWWDGARSLLATATAGRPVRFGAFPFIVVVLPDDETGLQRLYQAGAWLVLNPAMVPGCAPGAIS